MTPYRSYDVIIYDVIAGHEIIYVNKPSQSRGRDVSEVSLCLCCEDASTDIQYGLLSSFIRSGHLTWPQVLFSNWPFWMKIQVILCDLTREMRWSFAFFSVFFSSKVNCVSVEFTKKQYVFAWSTLWRSKCDLRFWNRAWLDSEHPKRSVRLCCEALFQFGGIWGGGAPQVAI